MTLPPLLPIWFVNLFLLLKEFLTFSRKRCNFFFFFVPQELVLRFFWRVFSSFRYDFSAIHKKCLYNYKLDNTAMSYSSTTNLHTTHPTNHARSTDTIPLTQQTVKVNRNWTGTGTTRTTKTTKTIIIGRRV